MGDTYMIQVTLINRNKMNINATTKQQSTFKKNPLLGPLTMGLF